MKELSVANPHDQARTSSVLCTASTAGTPGIYIMRIIFTALLLFSSTLNAYDYLVPITPFGNLYNQAVYESLIGEIDSELWMITRPSFSPEEAIIIEREIIVDKSKHMVTSRKYFLRHVLANEMIFRYDRSNKDHPVLDLKKTSNITVKRIEIDRNQYETIINAWKSGVRKTHYPEKSNNGLDGVTYQFYASYNLYGETWSPKQGFAYNLVALGKILSSIVDQPDNSESLLKSANEIANEILQTP